VHYEGSKDSTHREVGGAGNPAPGKCSHVWIQLSLEDECEGPKVFGYPLCTHPARKLLCLGLVGLPSVEVVASQREDIIEII
jgi:hypothetical protein